MLIYQIYLFGKLMILLRLTFVLLIVGCTAVQSERAITTAQYFAPLAVGIVAVQSFGSNK